MKPTNYEEPKVTTCDFGTALAYLKEGRRVTRRGWAMRGCYIYLVGAGCYPPTTQAGRDIAAEREDGLVPYLPYIALRTIVGVIPWTATTSDILADDWVLGL